MDIDLSFLLLKSTLFMSTKAKKNSEENHTFLLENMFKRAHGECAGVGCTISRATHFLLNVAFQNVVSVWQHVQSLCVFF